MIKVTLMIYVTKKSLGKERGLKKNFFLVFSCLGMEFLFRRSELNLMQDFNEYGRNVLTVKLEKICTYDCIYINISVIGVMVDLMWVGAMRLRKEGEKFKCCRKIHLGY